MRTKWTGMAALAGLLMSLTFIAPGCVVRAHGRASVVADEAPPEPQYAEQPAPREGYVWVRGHWEWRAGRWVWKRGYWKRDRSGYTWVPGHWERRGSRHHWVEGRWAPAGADTHTRTTVRVRRQERRSPTVVRHEPKTKVRVIRHHDTGGDGWIEAEPPPPKNESPGTRAGFIWVSGRWTYKNGDWQWINGHWERERASKRWVPGRWERADGRYRWVEGHWE